MTYAPIAAFVYKRPQHAQKMLQSLLANPEITTSPFYIFCDGARDATDMADVDLTRRVVHELAPTHAVVVERSLNLGLANSIISGVSDLCDRYGRAIVIEDDLLLSPATLRYLNDALNRYETEDRVMHISAYMFPIKQELPETFFYREATCWGWATWSRAWKKFEPDGRVIREYVLENNLQHDFDVMGSMFFMTMLEQQIEGKNNSWAIRWYGSMRMQHGLALHPAKSFVRNIGFDGTGEHCTPTDIFDVKIYHQNIIKWPTLIEESSAALEAMIRYRKGWNKQRSGLLSRLRRFVLSRR
jgi:hypothetical protein